MLKLTAIPDSQGPLSTRPAANAVAVGYVHLDTTTNILTISNGSDWLDEAYYNALQLLNSLASLGSINLRLFTTLPTINTLPAGQGALSLIAGVLSVHVNNSGTIETVQLGAPSA